MGNLGWSYQDVLPYFKKSEHQQRGADAYHGVDGELSVTDPIAPAAISQRFVDACVAMGYNYNPDFNAIPQEGAGLFQLTVKDGKRHSTAAAFLLPPYSLNRRAIATELTDSTVTVDVHDATITVKLENLNEIASSDDKRQLPQTLKRVRRLREVESLDRGAANVLKDLSKQTNLSPVEEGLLSWLEKYYRVTE